MPGQSIFDAALTLGDVSQVYWRRSAPASLFAGDLTIRPAAGDPPIAAEIIDGTGPTWPRNIRLRDDAGRVLINLSNTLDHESSEVDELTAAAERDIRLCVQFRNRRLTIAIGDTTEPYHFLPANAAEVLSFVTDWKADAGRGTEPVHAALVWGGVDSRIDFTEFTTRPPPLRLAATLAGHGRLGGRARLRRRLRLRATLTDGRLTGSAGLHQRLRLGTTLNAGGRATGRAGLRLRDPNAYAHALRASAPEAVVLTALEIRHPAIAEPVRVVNDAADHVIEGRTYVGLRFGARFADDIEGQAPRADLVIDNVGRELTQWIERAQGRAGATVRVMQVVVGDADTPEWEMTMDVAHVRLDQERVTARLGFDPLLGRAAVTRRHDPQTSPGLF